MSIKMKKLMSLLMCCVMLFGMLPVEAFATETGAETGIAAEENVAEVPAEVAPSADDSAADPAQILYNTLKSFNDYEALCAYLKSLSAEQLEMLKKFFAEQEMDLDAWIEAFQQQETTVEESAAEPAEDQAVQEEPAAISLETSLEREVLKAGKPSKPDGNGGHGDPNPDHEVTAPDTVSHIDVACEDLTAMIGGEPVTFSFTEEDVRNGAVVIYINDTKFTGTVGESDDNAGNNQVRLKGSFYIGKEDAPKEYTVKLEKTVTTEKYGKVAVTLSVTTNYWAENNVCPGKKSGGDPGIDVKLGVGEGTPKYTQLNISKVVEGLTLSEDKTFTFDIKKDEEIVETVTIVVKAGSAAGVTMVTGLPEGTYTVEERTDSAGVAGYRCDVTYTGNPAEVSYNAAASVEVKNTYAAVRSFSQEFGTVKITGKKIWVDDNNANGMRPDSIIVNLYADGVKVASQKVTGPDWSWSFDLSNGVPGSGKNPVGVTFTIGEENIPNYELTDVTQPTVTFNYPSADNGWEKTEPCSELNISSTQDAKSIIVAKKGNKYICWSVDALTAYERKLIVQSAAAAYNYSNNVSDYTFFSGMGSSSEFGMTVTETQILFDGSSNWSWFIKGTYNRGSASSTESSLTNTVTPVTISGSKTWNDNNNQDGARPESITINLLADGEVLETVTVTAENGWAWSFTNLPKNKDGVEIVYSITENSIEDYSTEYKGYSVINTHTPAKTSVTVTKVWDDANNQDGIRPDSVTIKLLANGADTGKTLELNAGNNWTGSFADLDKFAGGKEIVYTVAEVAVEGYETVITGDQTDGYTVTNTHTPETVEVSGSKTWNDNNNQDGARPESITINLVADGEVIQTVSVTEEDGWSWSFENLAKYKGQGIEIVYSITENAVEDYSTEYNGYNVINTHAPAQTSVAVTKVWNDANNQDGIRPDSVTITLLADGEDTGKTLVLSTGNNWTGSFTALDKFAGGKEIVYTVAEVAVEGYETVITGGQTDGYTVTNTHTPETVEVSGSKTWNDNNNQDGARPESITINLRADGEIIETVTVTAEDGWAWSFTNLPKNKDHGTAIVYSITEIGIEDYSTEYNGYNVINTHTPEQTSVTVSKAWNDISDQDGLRPESVTITLLADGEDTGKTLVLSAGNNWTGSFTALDKFAGGKEIVYTVAEVAVEGYETVITGDQIAGYIVTNTHIPETVEVSGSKTWNDNNNQDGARPESITIHLLANDTVIQTVTVTEADDWAWSFTELPKFEDHGKEITYTITEDKVAEYETVVNGYNVTNTHEIEKMEVDVTKAWEDNNDQDGIRPNAVTIQLLANGEETGKTLVLNAGNNWTGSFTELDKFENGVEIVYTVDELKVNGYKTVITGDKEIGYTVTNTHTPETLKVEGTKTWVDNNNQDGKRPASITINLLADGKVIKTVTVTEADDWAWSFESLPKYANGQEIKYTITENAVAEYETEVNGYNVTNTHKIEKTSVAANKVWVDNNDQDGIRPNTVTIQLLADGKATDKTLVLNAGNNWTGSFTDLDKYAAGKEITYSVKELTVAGYTSAITGNQAEGYTVTNTHIPAVVEISGTKTWKDNNDQDGARPASITVNLVKDGKVIATKTVTAADRWSWSFEGLPKYEKHGAEIIYSITENAVEDYTTTYNGYDVINTHTPEKTSVTVTKAWKDNNDQDGIRPNDVTITLLANGKDTRKTLVLNAANGWTGSFTGLDKFAEGKEVVYTVEELDVEGYTSVITGSKAAGFTVTNTHEPETLDISGKKTWDDEDNQDGKRPASITIRLLANGVEVDRITVTEAEGWDWNFNDLPKYENHGKEITYTITEDSVEGYTASYNGFNVTNKYTPEETSVTVTKSWQDNNDQDGIRPEKIIVNLLANGKKTASAELTAEGNWTHTFAELDVYANGEKIVYTVEEEAVEGYETVITGDASKGFTVTNSHTAETLEVSGKKTWEDDNNRDGKRPASITVRLLANGKEVAVATVTAEDAWSFKFTNLPKFEAGKEIVYTVTEDAVAGYSVEYSDKNFDITNKYTPGKTSITVTKRWIDGNNHDSIRPSSVTIYLYAGDVKVAELKLTAKDNWTGVFDNLHIYENGKAIEYSISEKSVRGYNATFTGSAQHGFTVTNTHNIIPKTGDESNLPMYVSMFGASVCALAVLMFLAKSKKKGKNAR